MSILSNQNLLKICHKFYCNNCDYGTSKKSSYTDHLNSLKHQKSIIGKQNSNDILPKICSEFICQNCNKKYKDNSGLWRHKKKCNINQIINDLEKVGKIGYVEGISNIIVKNLNSLDENKRPVHCTDSKREVIYVKDENKWEKENENKQKLRKVIKHITHKNSKLLNEFKANIRQRR